MTSKFREIVTNLQRILNIQKLTPFAKEQTAIGLDISQERITVVGLQASQQGFQLRYIGVSAVPDDSIRNGRIINVSELAGRIRELFTIKQIKTKRVIVGIWGPAVLIHLSNIPHISEAEMKEALKTEVAHYIIFTGFETVSDVYKLEEITEQGVRKSRVLLGIAKREIVDSYIETIKQAGLEPVAVDIGLLSIIRTLYTASIDASHSEPIVLIDIEFENTGICILREGSLSYFHSVDVGSGVLLEGEESISKLAYELEDVIDYYQLEYKQKIKSVFLAGDDIKGIDKVYVLLRQRLKHINIEKINVLEKIRYEEDLLSPEEKAALTYSYRAMGLAIRGAGAKGYPVNVNLLPLEEIRKKELKSQIAKFLIVLSGLFLFLFLYFITIRLQIGIVNQHVVDIQEELRKPLPVLTRLLGIEDEIKAYLDEIEIQKAIIYTAHRKRWDIILEEIRKIIPREVRLIRLTNEGNRIVFMGEANSQEAVFNFVRSLRSSSYFSEVNLHTSKDKDKDGKAYVDFDIRCQLRFKEGA